VIAEMSEKEQKTSLTLYKPEELRTDEPLPGRE